MTTINFTFADFLLALKEADNRHFRSVLRHFSDGKMARKTYADQLEGEIVGVLGEIAAARYFKLGDMVRNDTFTNRSDLPQNINIRATKYPQGRLLIQKDDKDTFLTVLVTVETIQYDPQNPKLGWLAAHFRGWISNHEAKQQRFWDDNLQKPCYAISQQFLRPMTELPWAIQKAAMNGQPLNGCSTTTTPDFPSF